MSVEQPKVILLLGVTASGKSDMAMQLASEFNAEIISGDSMQVYRRMDIGTAKPTPEEMSRVRHHLIDVVEPWESFSASMFTEMAAAAIHDIASRGKTPLIVGGTPLYLMSLMFGIFDGPSADESIRTELRERAAVEGIAALHAELVRLDPVAAERIHPNDYKRIERAIEVHRLTGRRLSEQQVQWSAGELRYPSVVVGLRREKEEASRRINLRVRQMVDKGLVDEVTRIYRDPRGMSEQAQQAVGYAEIIRHLEGEWTLDEAIERIKIHTRRLAKHQRTWFRKFTMAKWVDISEQDDEAAQWARVREAIANG